MVLFAVGAASLVVLLPLFGPGASLHAEHHRPSGSAVDHPVHTPGILLALAAPALGFSALIDGVLGTIQRRRKRWPAVVGGVLGALIMLAAYSYYWRPIISVMPM